MVRAGIRSIFKGLGALSVFDSLHFHLSSVRYGMRNRRFVAARPDFALPPDRLLHETYRLDYSAYAVDGEDTARELIDRCRPFLPRVPIDVLEWGCGVARITRHLPMLPDVASVTGVDVNNSMTAWNREHIRGVDFLDIGHEPPMPFEAEVFDLVLAVSVLTHIPGGEHAAWMDEVRRVLRPGGLFLFTTQGGGYLPKLTVKEAARLRKAGSLTREHSQRGHRLVSTFQLVSHVEGLLRNRFDPLVFMDGAKAPAAAGGQDLWLVRMQS